MICTYPFCENEALYRVEGKNRTVAFLCSEHYFDLKALGMVGKAYALQYRGDVDKILE